MEYRNIRVGQKLLLRGQLHGAYEAEVVLQPGEEPSLLWVNPDRLMDSDR